MGESKKKRNWKTTAAGIAGAIAILATQAQALLDDDPATKLSYAAIVTALGMLGVGWFSRDKDVSSEGTKVV